MEWVIFLRVFGGIQQRESCSCLAALADPAGVDWATVGVGRLRIAPWLLFQLADAHGVLPIVVHNYLQREQAEARSVIDPAEDQDATAESALAWAQQKLAHGSFSRWSFASSERRSIASSEKRASREWS